MPHSLSVEVYAAACAVLIGVLLGACYDGVRVLRILLGLPAGRALPTKLAAFRFPYLQARGGAAGYGRIGQKAQVAILFVTDFLFATGAGVCFTIFLFAFHDGVFRLFLLISFAFGLVAYFLTLGRLVSRVTGVIACLLRVLLAYLFLCLRVPIAFLFRLLFFAARFLLVMALRSFFLLTQPLFYRIILALRLSGLRRFLRAPLG